MVCSKSEENKLYFVFDFTTSSEFNTCLVIIRTQEVVYLVSQLVSSLAHREPVAFFSSVSHVWMEWVRDASHHFIVLLQKALI